MGRLIRFIDCRCIAGLTTLTDAAFGTESATARDPDAVKRPDLISRESRACRAGSFGGRYTNVDRVVADPYLHVLGFAPLAAIEFIGQPAIQTHVDFSAGCARQ